MNRTHIPTDSAGHLAEGTALVMALFLTIFALGIVISGSEMLKSNQTRTETQFLLHGQATNFARSGITEAINWLRRQTVQPVTVFDPVLDTVTVPPIIDTIEPEIGLVREFQITGNIWGRYEVWKQWDADPNSARLAWRQQMQVRDVSMLRDSNLAGNVWSLKCVAYVYRSVDSGVAYDQKPNQILASERLSTEVSRLSVVLPGEAAMCARVGGSVLVDVGASILGGSTAAGIFYPQGSGTPTINGSITGVPTLSPSTSYDDTVPTVFGVSEDSLRAMADDYITDTADIPTPLPNDSFLFIEAGPVTFDNTKPMSGSGILFVKGDLILSPGSSSLYSGLLYVDGNLSMSGACEIQGAVIVTGTVNLVGAGDLVAVDHNGSVLSNLQSSLGTYRISRSVIRANTAD